jgi:hypothetical protein
MTMTTPSPAASGRQLVVSAIALIGNRVVNDQDEDLGHVKELMINVATGQVAYAVLSFGGVLGMGDKLFAVPWSALRLNHQNKAFLLEVSKERLEEAPGFDKDHWPDMADPTWGETIDHYYRASVQRYDG